MPPSRPARWISITWSADWESSKASVFLTDMAFLQLIFDVGAADPAPFEEALLAVGALSITLEDAADDPVLEPGPGMTPLWPQVRIKALFDEGTDPEDVRAALAAGTD